MLGRQHADYANQRSFHERTVKLAFSVNVFEQAGKETAKPALSQF